MKTIILITAATLFLSGCATILNDETQMVSITTSNNTEIKGRIDGIPFSGPAIVAVKRSKAAKIITVDTPACSKQTLLQSEVDMKFFINILSGGTFGSSTDYASDEMWKYQDNVVIPCK